MVNVELESSRRVLRGTVCGSMSWETATLKRPRAASVAATNESMAGVLMFLVLVDA